MKPTRPRNDQQRKLYAMVRMRLAIDRAITAQSMLDKEKAARWASAWGTAAGIPKAPRKWDGYDGWSPSSRSANANAPTRAISLDPMDS